MGLRILIADDHKLVRKAIAALLSNHDGMQVIAEANDGREALHLARELQPDVAVMNIEMPNLNGVEATRQIVREVPGIRVVALSAHSDRRNVHAMLEAGARGYVSKHSEFEELVSAIKTVAGNGTYFSPELTSLVIEEFFASSEDYSCPLWGYSYKEVLGRSTLELFLEGEHKKHKREIETSINTGSVREFEMVALTKNGDKVPVALGGTALKDDQGNVTAAIAVIPDITERKEVEKRLQEYQAKLRSLASELSLAEERERRRIAAGIHDDIAQRLALTKLRLKSIQEMISDPNVSALLEKECETMDQIMNDARSLTFELSNPVLYEVGLEAAVESWLDEQLQRRHGIKCDISSDGSRLNLDQNANVILFQAVRELLSNVLKHANASAVRVCIGEMSGKVCIVVEDDGVGFDPSKLKSPGMVSRGFGLFNVKERLEYMGGNVDIESKPGQGTRVTMTLVVSQ